LPNERRVVTRLAGVHQIGSRLSRGCSKNSLYADSPKAKVRVGHTSAFVLARWRKMIDSDVVIESKVVMDAIGSDRRLREIASRFSELEDVEAVTRAGSTALGTSDSHSD
jgi:hypothetical protein